MKQLEKFLEAYFYVNQYITKEEARKMLSGLIRSIKRKRLITRGFNLDKIDPSEFNWAMGYNDAMRDVKLILDEYLE